MSKTWYPVLNYEICMECGTCYNKCKKGVYQKEERRPVVVYPEGCVQGCHGCGDLCPVGAIEYVGDTTGWAAPGKQGCCDQNSGGCSSGCCG